MPVLWIVQRTIIFICVRFFRLWSCLWRGNYQRFCWRLRTNARTRPVVEALQFLVALLWLVMVTSAKPKNRRVLSLTLRVVLLALLFLLCVTFNLPWATQHMAIVSTNYFPLSASYPPNTMVVLFNAQRRFWPPWPLLCRSQNASHSLMAIAKVRYAFTPILICGWSVYLAVCPTVRWPSEFALRDTQVSSRSVVVPYRRVSNAQFNVVSCFSPLFYNERWQLIIPTLEIYRQMGVSLQVYYVQSMLVEILEFMRAYERAGVLRLETWNGLSVVDPDGQDRLGYDPNVELEWRLGKTFVEEFRWLSAEMPWAAGFSYNRYNTELVTSNEPVEFSLAALLNEARVATEWEDPKYVVRPSRVQSVWLHWPGIIDRGSMHTVPDEQNFMLHFRNWSMIDYSASALPRTQRRFRLFQYQMADVLRPLRAVQLEHNFHQFLDEVPGLADLFSRLPQKVVYYPLIADCYNRIFYARSKHPANCPGPLRCYLPSLPGVRCALGKRRFGHSSINGNLIVHYPLDASGSFYFSDSGCTM